MALQHSYLMVEAASVSGKGRNQDEVTVLCVPPQYLLNQLAIISRVEEW